MTKIQDLMKRQNQLLGRIAAFKAFERSNGYLGNPEAFRQHQQEVMQIGRAITAERKRWEAAHPKPAQVRSMSGGAARPPAPAAVRSSRLTREQFLDRAVLALEGDTGGFGYAAIRDLALRTIERRDLPPTVADRLDSMVRNRDALSDGKLVARYIVVTGSPAYEEAFRTAMSQVVPAFSPRAGAALEDFRDLRSQLDYRARQDAAARFAAGEIRAMDEGTSTAGGLAVPFWLDPTITMTSGLGLAQILRVCRQETITSSAWHGVTASTSGFTTTAEGSASSDDSPTFAAPGADSIPLYTGRDWIEFSVEYGMDQPDWSTHAAQMFGDSYANFISTKTATGSGSSDLTGVFTRMSNTTTSPSHVTVTTAGTIGAVDLRAAWSALPERYRVDPSCAWMMSPSVEQKVSVLAAPSQTDGLSSQDYTSDPATGERRLFGKPVIVADACPSFTGTTGSENFLVVGAFSRFLVASRLGSFEVELVPNVPNFSAGGRPSGNRGFQATVRAGSDVINADAFRILSNS